MSRRASGCDLPHDSESGEYGNNTWEGDSWSYTGNTGVWGPDLGRPKKGMAYLPVESATGDYYGGHRPGNNLYGESIVAVDLKTGQRKWHYQLVHHGIWDHDIPCAPILMDIVVNGQPVKALAQPTKQAFLYVFDRVTGKPIWPIEERPVEKGDVPGEWYAATQPFPLDARGNLFQYDRNGFVHDDLIDFTPELRAEGEKVISRYKIGPVFTPPVVSKVEGPLATIQMAVNGGGTVGRRILRPRNPHHNVYSRRQPSALGLIKPDPTKNDMNYVQGSALTGAGPQPQWAQPRRGGRCCAGRVSTPPSARCGVEEAAAEGGPGLTVQGLPLSKPPYGASAPSAWTRARSCGKSPTATRRMPSESSSP